MPVQIDDIKVGQWLVISKSEGSTRRSMWGPIETEPEYDGAPFKVIAVSLPFIAIRLYHGRAATLDTRVHWFSKADPKYVQVLIDQVDNHPEARPGEREKPLKRRRRRLREPQPAGMEAIDPSQCRRCGNQCNQRMNYHARQWEFVCATCGHNQGPVPN